MKYIINIHDTDGKLVLQKALPGGSTEYKLDTSTLHHGVYTVTISGKVNLWTKVFVISG